MADSWWVRSLRKKLRASEKTNDELKLTVSRLRLWMAILIGAWLITVSSGVLLVYTLKYIPIEAKMAKPNFGSVYPNGLRR